MRHFKEHLIVTGTSIRDALSILDKLAPDAICFVVNDELKLLGSLTDGDIRRGLIAGIELDDTVDSIIQKEPKFLRKGDYDLNKVIEYRDNNYKVIPIVTKKGKIINVINFRHLKSYLPIDVVIMAGGKGTRLRPLTEKTPKPLLKVGEKPILEHNITRLALFGMDDFWISVNYLGEQIEEYFGNGSDNNLKINYWCCLKN